MQPEEHLLLRCERRGDGRVQRVHHRRGELEVANDDVGESCLERRLRRQRGGQPPLAALDQVQRRMLGGKALGRTRERVAFKFDECLPDRWLLSSLRNCA